jgi:hypothetical protein
MEAATRASGASGFERHKLPARAPFGPVLRIALEAVSKRESLAIRTSSQVITGIAKKSEPCKVRRLHAKTATKIKHLLVNAPPVPGGTNVYTLRFGAVVERNLAFLDFDDHFGPFIVTNWFDSRAAAWVYGRC